MDNEGDGEGSTLRAGHCMQAVARLCSCMCVRAQPNGYSVEGYAAFNLEERVVFIVACVSHTSR